MLGEVYGLQAHSGLNRLSLSVRRVRSNIDDNANFAKTVNFLPQEISFTVSDSELLKLLVGPLYSHDVSIGLRELVQNSVDSVKEIDSLFQSGLIGILEKRHALTADVEVRISSQESANTSSVQNILAVEIIDRGVGMTAETLRDYFFRAGATFRRSAEWRRNFEEIDGTEKIQRSGKFGVGVLAAFLLGDKIHVETRHYSEARENGLKFTAGIDDSAISVVKHTCEIGTKITIEVPDARANEVLALIPGLDSTVVSIRNPISRYFGKKNLCCAIKLTANI